MVKHILYSPAGGLSYSGLKPLPKLLAFVLAGVKVVLEQFLSYNL